MAACFADGLRDLLDEKRLSKSSDANVVFYVTGALVRSEIAQNKCKECTKMLVSDGDSTKAIPLIKVDGAVSEDVSTFWSEVNRGGLLYPSNLAFSIGLKCWDLHIHWDRVRPGAQRTISVKS